MAQPASNYLINSQNQIRMSLLEVAFFYNRLDAIALQFDHPNLQLYSNNQITLVLDYFCDKHVDVIAGLLRLIADLVFLCTGFVSTVDNTSGVGAFLSLYRSLPGFLLVLPPLPFRYAPKRPVRP